jgi:hypothetical protein
MSLIDEALKRAQEASQREGEKAQQRPWTPPPLPDAGLARRRAAVRVGLRILGVAAGVVVLVFLGRLVWDAAAPGTPAAPAPARRAAAVPVPTSDPTFPETVVPTPNATASSVAAARTPAPPRPTKVAIPQSEDVSPGVIEVPPPTSTLNDGRTFVRVLNLPEGRRIELGGIVWSEEEPRALLNDRIVATDAYVEGFTVAKIEENRVALEKDGITIYLVLK